MVDILRIKKENIPHIIKLEWIWFIVFGVKNIKKNNEWEVTSLEIMNEYLEWRKFEKNNEWEYLEIQFFQKLIN